MTHTPITIDMRILNREEAADILTEELHSHLYGGPDAVEQILDVLSRHYILLLCPDNQPIHADDES